MSEAGAVTPMQEEQLPSLAYRGWFLLVLLLVSASVNAERYLMAVMVTPIKADLGLNDFQIGLAKDMAIALVYIVAVIPLGRIADRWSKRKMVALAATIWSVAVLICAQARGFATLLMGRALIGLGEGAYTPPSQSWLADKFPMNQRATALALFLLGASLGTFAGPAVGGGLTEEYGWRTAMLLMSLPGFVLVPLVWFTLRDVRPGLADNSSAEDIAVRPFGETMRQLMGIKSLPLIIMAAAFNTLPTMGLVTWAPAFMERTHGMSPREAGLAMGFWLFFGSLIGHTVGGPLSDWLGRKDVRWYVWILMVCGLMATGIAFVMLNGPGAWAMPLLGLNMLIGGASAAALLATVAGLAPAHSRSVAVACLMVAINVIGIGGGPAFVGWLSDLLAPTQGAASLGLAMQSVLIVGIPSAICAWLASTHLKGDLERAGGWKAGKAAASLH